MKMALMKSLSGNGSEGGGMDWMKQMMFMGGGMRLKMVQNPETGQYEAEFVPGGANGNGAASVENTLVTTLLGKVVESFMSPKEEGLTAVLLPKLIDSAMNKPSLG